MSQYIRTKTFPIAKPKTIIQAKQEQIYPGFKNLRKSLADRCVVIGQTPL